MLCGNDILAYGALQECLWQNLKVPHDISIAGFDNIEMAAHCRPGITTLDVPAAAIGDVAGQTLLAAQGSAADAAPAHFFVELGLIVRDSTAPPASSRSPVKGRRKDAALALARAAVS